jgi:hypothetical protein
MCAENPGISGVCAVSARKAGGPSKILACPKSADTQEKQLCAAKSHLPNVDICAKSLKNARQTGVRPDFSVR